jgi:hypothetical protein
VLLTEEYRKILEKTHEETNHNWGQTAPIYARDIITDVLNSGCKNILDYGSAHGSFRKSLNPKIFDHIDSILEYDPGYPDKVDNNQPSEYVICIDVLEHVEPEAIENVLDDLQRCLLKRGYFTISIVKARQILTDGRNAHLIVEPPSWWREKLLSRFDIVSEKTNQHTYAVILNKKEDL